MRSKLERDLEDTRQSVRAALVEFWVLDPELARFAVVNAEGLDATIAHLCAPFEST